MKQETTKEIMISRGFGFGTCLAMVISWSYNHSILWAILHGICGWFYVVYRAF